jgi:hypothetical protein
MGSWKPHERCLEDCRSGGVDERRNGGLTSRREEVSSVGVLEAWRL